MKRLQWLVDALDHAQIAFVILMGGIVFGLAYGWIAGVSVVAVTVCMLYGIHRAFESLRRKSLETKIPQRRFPGPRSK